MVQQNLVSYIISQIKQGKTLQQINEFLLQSGYDKQDVESSIQYVLNTRANPALAEQQRIQQLTTYIQKQSLAGYDQQTISNFLVSRGYPYFEVNSAVQQVNQQTAYPKTELKTEHKMLIIALIAMVVMTGLISFLYIKANVTLSGMPEQLLDVDTEQLTTLVKPGGELTFQIDLINFGHGKRFDITLKHQIRDRNTDTIILEKEQTLALSTTLQKLETFKIPANIKTGNYVLKTEAIYEDFVATSGFIFEIIDEEEAKQKQKETEKLLPEESNNKLSEKENNILENENIKNKIINDTSIKVQTSNTSIDKKEIVKGSLNGTIKENSDKTQQIKPETLIKSKQREKTFYDGLTKEQAFERVKAISQREPEKAIEMCKTYLYIGTTEQCITMLAEFKKDGMYCEQIERNTQKSQCYFSTAQTTKDSKWCQQINNTNIKQSCDILTTIYNIQDKGPKNTNSNELFSLIVQPQQ